MTDWITLRKFIAGLDDLPRQGSREMLWPEAVTLMLDGRGAQNAHLAFPVDPAKRKRNGYDREIPLSLDERVYGDHLLLTWFGHEPELVLTEHGSLEELKSKILAVVGCFSPWVNAQFVFHKLKPLPFSIDYTDVSGVRKTFDIEERERLICEYRDVKFEWLYGSVG